MKGQRSVSQQQQQQPDQKAHRPGPRQEGGMIALAALTPAELSRMPAHASGRPLRQAAVLQMQQRYGNASVQRFLAGRLQREGEGQPSPAGSAAGQPTEFREVTVPVPEAQQQAAAQDAGQPAVPPQGPQPAPAVETPPVPPQARIRIPLQLDYDLLPPELRIRLLEELNFTATVSNVRLQWQRRRFGLGLSYDYGGAITGSGRLKTGVGTFTGSAGFDPNNTTGSFRAGFQSGQWRAGASASTTGTVGAQVGFGRELPPMPEQLGQHMTAAEAGGRNLLGSVPGVLNDPRTLPGVMGEHSQDIDAISTAVEDIGRIADLRKQDDKKVDWGFYLRASAGPQSGLGLTAGAGIFFKRADGDEQGNR